MTFKPSPYNRHSPLAAFIHNQTYKTDSFHRASARASRVFLNPVVPLSLFVGHLYLIALFLRNPLEKKELN